MFGFSLSLYSQQYFFGAMRNKPKKQPLEVFCKKKKKEKENHLCQSLFFNKVADLRSETLL